MEPVLQLVSASIVLAMLAVAARPSRSPVAFVRVAALSVARRRRSGQATRSH